MSGSQYQTTSQDETNPFLESKIVGNPGLDFEKYNEIPVETSGRDCPPPISAWKDADLGHTIMANIEAAKYTKPTPIQKNSIPIVMKARDLLGCAQTGSGKTAAFLIPLIARMKQNGLERHVSHNQDRYGRRKICPFALILSPTRELAQQIYDESLKFGYKTGIRSCVVYGGTPIGPQLRDLDRFGCDLLVATPGRLSDIIDRGNVAVTEVKFLVLDEADRMLDMGFEPQIRKIVEQSQMPPTGVRQTLMFSATFPKEIQRLASTFLQNDYIFLAVGRVGQTADLVKQNFMLVEENFKQDTLINLLTKDQEQRVLTLIFVDTKRMASQLDYMLRRRGIAASSIHGDRDQADRTAALRAFSSGQTPVLIATNVAARGLDIENISHVINYDMPANIDDYVHRIGRTGRAGKAGTATTFLTSANVGAAGKLIDILRDSNQEIPPFLQELKSSYREKPKKYGAKFGGKDFRKKEGYDFNKAARGPNTGGYNNQGSSYGSQGSYGGNYGAQTGTSSYGQSGYGAQSTSSYGSSYPQPYYGSAYANPAQTSYPQQSYGQQSSYGQSSYSYPSTSSTSSYSNGGSSYSNGTSSYSNGSGSSYSSTDSRKRPSDSQDDSSKRHRSDYGSSSSSYSSGSHSSSSSSSYPSSSSGYSSYSNGTGSSSYPSSSSSSTYQSSSSSYAPRT